MSHKKLLKRAAKMSRFGVDDKKTFYFAAIAIRGDDVTVASYNGNQKFPTPEHHCEARLVRKLDRDAIVYLARTTADGNWAMSRPCADCMRALRRARVKKVYFTIAPNEYGCINFRLL